MKVSIITPVWNQYKITDKFYMLNSIHLASYISDIMTDKIEFIAVNNGSIDETQIRLEFWQQQFDNDILKVINVPENTGFGPGHNLGAKNATGDILIHVSNDVIPHDDYVRIVCDAIRNDPNKLYGARLLDYDTGWNSFAELPEKFIPYLEGWFIACHKDVWAKLGGFDERYIPCDFEDIDLSYMAKKLGIELVELDIPVKHFSGQTASKELDRDRDCYTRRNRELFIDKWQFSKQANQGVEGVVVNVG